MLGLLWQLCQQSEAYRRLWDGLPPHAHGPCRFLGPDTGQRRECDTCQGRVRLKVFHCQHPAHTTTTLTECARCPDREEV